MRHKQIEGEIKYRFACLLLNQMLKDKFITKQIHRRNVQWNDW